MMIYIDSSLVLAQLLAEDRLPPEGFWRRDVLVSSRLLEYEVWNRLNSRGLRDSHGEDARSLLDGIVFVELVAPALQRALEPFPIAVRALDALHLASIDFLQRLGQEPGLATYDRRLAHAASAMGVPMAGV